MLLFFFLCVNHVPQPRGRGHFVFSVDPVGVTLSCPNNVNNVIKWLDSYQIFMAI